jgi:hypothetical protein
MKEASMFFSGMNGRRQGFAGAFVQSLVFDAVFAYARMNNPQLPERRNARNAAEWEICTEILARFLGVGAAELRVQLIEERDKCRDLRLCSDRIFAWAYRQARPW